MVDDEGNVDQGKLEVALQSVSWGQSPASKAAPVLIKALAEAYNAAKDRGNVKDMLVLKDRIYRLGGTL